MGEELIHIFHSGNQGFLPMETETAANGIGHTEQRLRSVNSADRGHTIGIFAGESRPLRNFFGESLLIIQCR